MKKILLLTLFPLLGVANAKELTVQNVYEEILSEEIQKPRYVLAQSALETAWYQSYNCTKRNNLFGFRSSSWSTSGNPRGYKIFESWEESVAYYKGWQDRRGIEYKSYI